MKPGDVMSIIFTSGSTGEPKGVMLTHDNIASNLEAVRQLLQLKTTDMILGVLPFFHSFGYTVSMWLPLCTAPGCVYHFNPLDSRTCGARVTTASLKSIKSHCSAPASWTCVVSKTWR